MKQQNTVNGPHLRHFLREDLTERFASGRVKETNNKNKNTYSHEMAFWDVIDPVLLLTGWDLHWIGGRFKVRNRATTFFCCLFFKQVFKIRSTQEPSTEIEKDFFFPGLSNFWM